jgi:ABC-type multidrug transport system fused ATPase/permease subunit
VGSGKSSLLLALLGELHPASAAASRRLGGGGARADAKPSAAAATTVCYAPQEPWVLAASVRDNVLLRSSSTSGGAAAAPAPVNEAAYAATLDACALRTDLKLFPDGDATHVGERGVTLSGGQRARLSLARACYAAAAALASAPASAPAASDVIVLLDDPLAAVDAATGAHLVRAAVCGPLLAGATRLLVTHQRQWLRRCDAVAVMDGGRIVYHGPPGPLLAAGGGDADADAHADADAAAELAAAAVAVAGAPSEDGGAAEDDAPRELTTPQPSLQPSLQPRSPRGSLDDVQRRSFDAGGAAAAPRAAARASPSKTPPPQAQQACAVAADAPETPQALPPPPPPPVRGLIEPEERAEGVVTWHTYRRYVSFAGGVPVAAATLAAFVAQAAARVAVDLWLAWWADRRFEASLSLRAHVGIFGALTGATVALSAARAAGFTAAALTAASGLHDAVLARVLRAPVAFFDSTPLGRVLNRFSRDQAQADADLPQAAQFCGELLAGAAAGACVVAAILPAFSACLLPLALAFAAARRRYARLSRDAKRIEGVARSPILSHAGATAAAAACVRAAGAAPAFAAEFNAHLDAHNRAHFAFVAAGRWLGLRLDALAACAVATAAACVVASRATLPPGLAGMALVSSLTFTGTLQYAVRQLAETENLMTSVERLLAFTQLPQEAAPASAPGAAPPPGWPAAGALTVQQLTIAYHPGAAPVLKGISFALAPGAKVGLLGRTGAGKSTLAGALFRLVENAGCSGRIILDGVDIATIGLDELRSRISLIPQEPVLFTGSLRLNLDPFGHASDAEVDALLPRLGLCARAGAAGAAAAVTECGDNLSAGERALVCLGRALLRASRLLVCDEATAACDAACDARIQAAIRQDFAACTVLTIAHRLDTIIDADAVIILAPGGTLAEEGVPAALLESAPDGHFGAMVAATGGAHAAALGAAARAAREARRRPAAA